MDKKFSKLVGLTITEFNKFIEDKQIVAKPAVLIPVTKPDEMALTSIFLSSLKLIKEFRKEVLSEMDLGLQGSFHYFTEVRFPSHKDSRIDGLILIEKSKEIQSAIIFEMKTGNEEIEAKQLEKYTELAKAIGVEKIVTVTNQFVSHSKQSPWGLKSTKSLQFYHIPWSKLLTIAYLLLDPEKKSIGDEDQISIMREVVTYFNNKDSGVCGFNQMKEGWTKIVDKLKTGAIINSSDSELIDCVSSWHQEEIDLTLTLSQKLRLMVQNGDKKSETDVSKKLDADIKKLLKEKCLDSCIKIKDAVSPIDINVNFSKQLISMSVDLKFPLDKKLKQQVSYISSQVKNGFKKEPTLFETLKKNLYVDFYLKNKSEAIKIPISDLENAYEQQSLKEKELRSVSVVFVEDYGKILSHPKNFIKKYEQDVENFYQGLVCHLKNYFEEAPKMQKTEELISSSIVVTDVVTPEPTKDLCTEEPAKDDESNAA